MNGFLDTALVCICLLGSGWIMRMMYELQRDSREE